MLLHAAWAELGCSTGRTVGDALDWTGNDFTRNELRERGFTLDVGGRSVPGVLWTPETPTPGRPLLLLAHGGTHDKHADYIQMIARNVVRKHGGCAVAIDGPGHGDRLANRPESPEEARRAFEAAWTDPGTTDTIVADWRATLDAALAETAAGPVGLFGFSMGTMVGAPVCAAEPRVRAAVLGLMGFWGPNSRRLRDDAGKIDLDQLRFYLQWDDEVVPRERGLALFEAFGTKRKQLRAHPGAHAAVPVGEMRQIADFLVAALEKSAPG